METLKKSLSGLVITIIGVVLFVLFRGGLLGILGIILFVIGLIRWNSEIKNKKKIKKEELNKN